MPAQISHRFATLSILALIASSVSSSQNSIPEHKACQTFINFEDFAEMDCSGEYTVLVCGVEEIIYRLMLKDILQIIAA